MNTRLTALDFITRVLGSEASNDSLRTEITTGQPPWEMVVSLANDHLLTPALWVALNNRSLTNDLPEELTQYLHELHRLSCERNRQLRLQLLEATRQLNTAGITPVLLKGARHLVTTVYADPGIRIMTDIDLLISRADIPAALDTLQQLGYEPDEDVHGDYHDEHHHCAPLFRPDDYGTLEIHRHLMEPPYAAILPLDKVLSEREALEVEGARMQLLSPTHRLLHNIVHSQLVDHHHDGGIIPLRSLHEVVTEQSVNGRHVDWTMIDRQMMHHKRTRVLRAYLFMAHTLFGMPFPSQAQPTLGARLYYQRCRAQLRWRWAWRWGLRIGRYSADMMNERYACGHGWAGVNRSRVRQLVSR